MVYLYEEEEDVLALAVGLGHELRVLDELLQDLEPGPLVSGDQRLALALFPAVAVGGGRGLLQLAVVALVADLGALGAAAQRVGQATGAALENVLKEGNNTTG